MVAIICFLNFKYFNTFPPKSVQMKNVLWKYFCLHFFTSNFMLIFNWNALFLSQNDNYAPQFPEKDKQNLNIFRILFCWLVLHFQFQKIVTDFWMFHNFSKFKDVIVSQILNIILEQDFSLNSTFYHVNLLIII